MQINDEVRYTVTIKEEGTTTQTVLELVPKLGSCDKYGGHGVFKKIVDCCRDAIDKMDI